MSKTARKARLQSMRDVIRAVADAPEWHIFARNNSRPGWLTIAMCAFADVGEFAAGHWVFEAAGLELDALTQIFGGTHRDIRLPISERARVAAARDYSSLDFCRIEDDEAWKALAKLANKEIHLVHSHGGCEGQVRAVFYPDGRVEEVNRNT